MSGDRFAKSRLIASCFVVVFAIVMVVLLIIDVLGWEDVGSRPPRPRPRCTRRPEPGRASCGSGSSVRLFPHQSCDGAVDIDPTSARSGAPVWKVDPALVKPVDHLHAGKRVAHAFAAEDFLPARAGHSFGTDRSVECLGEGGRYCVWRHPLALELDDAVAGPLLLQ